MSKECSPRTTQTIPSPDPSCPLLSRHQLRVFAVLSKPGCTHVQRERSPEPSPKRDAAGVSRSLLFHPPFLHIVRTRVPPRVQRPQAEPEPVTPGCNEGRGARNLSRGRNTIAILSGPGPNQQRHPGWGGSIRGGPLPAEAGSAHAPPTSGSDPPGRRSTWYASRWRPPWCGVGCSWLGEQLRLAFPWQVGGYCLGGAAPLGPSMRCSLNEGSDKLSRTA